ncbi:MAG: nucleoside triphosphate pyrophosphohydrolase [Bacteroidota bacterium]
MKDILREEDPNRAQKLEAFDRLLTIMDELRLNCPWDKKQTWETLRYLTIEETYELSDAILEGDAEEIRKELGDLMLHMVFYARIGQEKEQFNVADVLHGVCEKLINRHPHIYGDVDAEDEETVKANWEKIKLKEKGDRKKSVLEGVPKSLPSMVKAQRIQEKARGVGFDWEEPGQVWDKVREEMEEFHEEHDAKQPEDIDREKATGEFGDLLFSLINYARFIDINPDEALENTNRKFIKRFQYLEEASAADGKELGDMTLNEMEAYWQAAKSL